MGECMLCQQDDCPIFLLASNVVASMIDGWLVGGCYDGALLV